jgi:S-adenosylmethionine:tRNA ribosyltransferase-isomerase
MFLLDDYDYELPEELIAQKPVAQRDQSRLLKLDRNSGNVSHDRFLDIYDYLRPGDVLVVNNTEVVPARLIGKKETGGRVEVLILDYARIQKEASENGRVTCQCLIKSSRPCKIGTRVDFGKGLTADIGVNTAGIFSVAFDCNGYFEILLYELGKVPLPPYIQRGDAFETEGDKDAYQTIYASQKGAAAAPTAGLHFSNGLMEKIKEKGVLVVPITLHVGYGTFRPVKVTDIRDHEMHSEDFVISSTTADTINKAKEDGRRVIAVGTTSVRTLEYVADDAGRVSPGGGYCDLFIYPGYAFKAVDGMITNFHLPKSTLLMLVSAFAGLENILSAYKEAVEERYRFFSYGDGMLIV